MGKSEILKNISKAIKQPKNVCEAVLESLIEEIQRGLILDGKVLIANLMSLEVVEKGERRGRHPITGEVITFPPSKSVKCKISKAIKDSVNFIGDEEDG